MMLTLRLWTRRLKERVPSWIAAKLPRSVVMRCYLRVGAHATTGQFSNTNVVELPMMEALRRWDIR